MPEITMPRLSDTMEDGVIIAWHKKIGDRVERGEVLAEIETDKAIMELEAYDAGILEHMLAGEGDRVPIGVPIAVIGDGSATSAAPQPVPPTAPQPELVAAPQPSTPAVRSDRPKASPLARKVADANGIDLTTVDGSGPGGRIIRKDVDAAVKRGETPVAPNLPANSDADEVPLTTLQRVAAKRLTESKQNAPHFYLTAAVDVTDLLAFRETVNDSLQADGGPKVSVNDFIVRAVASALRTNPGVNVSFGGDVLLRHHGVHIGVAVAVDAGLVVPVVRDADRKTVSQIAAETKEMAGRARIGKLRADEMSGGTFTISNLGMYGIEQFAAVINPPEAAILAVGAAAEELRLIDGEVAARKVLRLTLSADHRAIDGATAAIFLRDLTALLQNPLRIVT
ncbi:dihydrolipoamide acetyltransferase family protein [Mycolicibacterium brisbanense]|uniref:Dihydrolipoamide acetyltransferase component of pyruvate dehydrogenase complex n=1 Tax=Mycolicibacterium brisbanense TaxID=146020 RepID=A0A100VUW1_9MYCO|nr:dihydrolipoamide acetyltransferase family protein [Mycolicibacterium brisbanense]MCV7156590.1 2-oxo acid dehydrogenase subunit E2 [Mycolicibacterium brisbanense]GAS86487.1 pyruvate/2-oxoglutarate dehydrogenase complex, dihydrolipoamide acyltransferase component [Mycolicibacterium brisbanense]